MRGRISRDDEGRKGRRGGCGEDGACRSLLGQLQRIPLRPTLFLLHSFLTRVRDVTPGKNEKLSAPHHQYSMSGATRTPGFDGILCGGQPMTSMTVGSEGRDNLALGLIRIACPSRLRMPWFKKDKKSRRPLQQLGPLGVPINIAVGPFGPIADLAESEGVSSLVWWNVSTDAVDLTTTAGISSGSRRSRGECAGTLAAFQFILTSTSCKKRVGGQGHRLCHNRPRSSRGGGRSVRSPQGRPGNRLRHLRSIQGSFATLCQKVPPGEHISRKLPLSRTRSKSSVHASLCWRSFLGSPLIMQRRQDAGKDC